MTKPCNFPERRNTRRKGALERLERALALPLSFPRTEKNTLARKRAVLDSEKLALRIVGSARQTMTKKRRAARL